MVLASWSFLAPLLEGSNRGLENSIDTESREQNKTEVEMRRKSCQWLPARDQLKSLLFRVPEWGQQGPSTVLDYGRGNFLVFNLRRLLCLRLHSSRFNSLHCLEFKKNV